MKNFEPEFSILICESKELIYYLAHYVCRIYLIYRKH